MARDNLQGGRVASAGVLPFSPMPRPAVDLSIIAPAHNEAENLPTLVAELEAALDPLPLRYDVVLVNDGSGDRTAAVMQQIAAAHPRVTAISMLRTPPGRGHGQSAAFHAGIRFARGHLIALLDADLQNDPADIPLLLRRMHETGADFVQGDRSHSRKDNPVRRVSSVVGRLFRRGLLGDTIRDTGCSLRLMRREVAEALPLQFRGMHRFIPITARQLGFNVVEVPVHHRPRAAGRTNYGICNRALPGLIDCFAVRWMHRRRRPVEYVQIEPLPVETRAAEVEILQRQREARV